MLEGWAARLLHRIFGAFVDDLDTERLDAGVFSGEVHLRDLRLRPDALATLGLPVRVRAGAIGTVHLQIPWAAPWGSPVALRVEDVRVLVVPAAGAGAPSSDSVDLVQLRRAVNKHLLDSLDEFSADFLEIPHPFAQRLISALLRRLQISINGIHLRYEDSSLPATAGICISTIVAEPTDSKWKPTKNTPSSSRRTSEPCHYLARVEALSVYLNPGDPGVCWKLTGDFYQWWNDMGNGLRDYAIGRRRFEFLLTPTAIKIKASLTQSSTAPTNVAHIEIAVRDVCTCLSAKQCDVAMAISDSLVRAWRAWPYQEKRPSETKMKSPKAWWRYAYWATLEQRVRPYTWARVRAVRQRARLYRAAYGHALDEPRDAERQADLGRLEDGLPLVAAAAARRLARLSMHKVNNEKKNFWSLMPSPDRLLLCEKIGYSEKDVGSKVDHHYSFKVGNLNLSLTEASKEILHVTVTQTIVEAKPNFASKTYRATLKIEGVIVEGSCEEDHLIPVISSEHLSDSPAYVLQVTIEKLPKNSFNRYKVNGSLDSIEFICNEKSFNDLKMFLVRMEVLTKKVISIDNTTSILSEFIDNRLRDKWDINLNIKIPYFVIPAGGSYLKAEHILVVDFGRYIVKTELCKDNTIPEFATQNEIEELVYSKIHVNCSDAQVLFCDNSENWKDARKEKDTSMHMMPKIGFTAMYARSVVDLKTIPKRKFILTIQSLKLNTSERWTCLLLTFFGKNSSTACNHKEMMDTFDSDRILGNFSASYLLHVRKLVSSKPGENLRRRSNGRRAASTKQKSIQKGVENNMNEAWARVVDLPGLEDNISPNNNINILLRFVVNEFILTFSKSSDVSERPYLVLRLGLFASDIAFMTYGPAYQISLGWASLTDKLHTTVSGQYLDLVHSPLPTKGNDVVTILYRKVTADCPDYWTHFHGVETSLVADFGTLNILLHQESVHTFVKYFKYLSGKLESDVSSNIKKRIWSAVSKLKDTLHPKTFVPVPPGSVKYSQSARVCELRVALHDAEKDVAELRVSGVEADALFRANERFVIRAFLAGIAIDHPLDESALYSKVLWTDEERVFEAKYVRNAPHIRSSPIEPIAVSKSEIVTDGSFKLQLGRIYVTVLYKFVIQLKRFIINLDAKSLVEQIFHSLHGAIRNATDTLKDGYKISLAINACNPVLLLPQKSCSPNVVVVDTGSLRIENFFKEKGEIIVENVLVKLKDMTVTRGVMTFSSTLEMQETLLEPVSLNMDVKKLTNTKTLEKTWDVDSVIERIHITLGQKDLTSMVAIYRDNIGEGKFQDLFREQLNLSPETTEDESVRDLEAFFYEPKQEIVVVKFKVDEIEISLFFDGGEVLSSPVREPGRGLCAVKIFDASTRVESQTGSIDSRIAVALVQLEERGQGDNNIILGPSQSKSRNTGPVLINEPPLLDATLKRSRSGDVTADVILGSLALKLSTPLFERIALFSAGCLPSLMMANSVICGLDNPGYESERIGEQKPFCKSLALSVRLNQPNIIFLVETTSNGERYFVTKSEILIDYSRHNDSSTLVVSLSGLQSTFCDSSKDRPPVLFAILRPCDTELSYSESSSSEKTMLAFSSIQIRLNPAVVHAVVDTLNDMAEHFKVADFDFSRTSRHKVNVKDDTWEPTKLEPYIASQGLDEQSYCKASAEKSFSVPKFEVVVIFELEGTQVLLTKVTLELNLNDWNYLANCIADVTLQANYFCDSAQAWEPLIDPITTEFGELRPWDVGIRIFQDIGHPMTSEDDKATQQVRSKSHSKESGSNDCDSSSEDMIYLERSNDACVANRRMKASLSAFLEDSDSENEEGMDRLAAAISNLFTGDWNEHEDSDIDDTSDEEVNSEIEAQCDGEEQRSNFVKCLYIMMDAKHPINITITPSSLKILDEVLTQFSSKVISVRSESQNFSLCNDIGPRTRVELFERLGENMDRHQLITTHQFDNVDSAPNSPSKGTTTSEDGMTNTFHHQDSGHFDECESLNSLDFHEETISQLQEKIRRHFLRIHIPDLHPVELSCPKINWEQIIRVRPKTGSNVYHLALRHNIDRSGRDLLISSPLQVTNETTYSLSVLYRPAVLQQLDLEPLGSIINPFSPVMRVATLQPHETFHVPLHVAYHCQLYIQPAYADEHHASDDGIWWKDMAKDLNATTDIICNPKVSSNQEVFAIRVNVSPNISLNNANKDKDIPNYNIRLLPPLQLHNFLPYTLEIESNKLQQKISIEPGDKTSIYSLDLTKDQRFTLTVKNNLKIWSGTLNLTTNLDEKAVTLSSKSIEDSQNLVINVKCDRKCSRCLCFYVPYWIVNKTSLLVEVKAASSNTVYPANDREILPFTYKHYSANPSIQFRVNQSLWSPTCNGECAGTTGLIVCRDPERHRKYHFFMQTELSKTNPALTRIVTLLPAFLIENRTEKMLRYMEANERADLWVEIRSSEMIPFYPETSSMLMHVRYETGSPSAPFRFDQNQVTALRMDKGSSITVKVSGGVYTPFHIIFRPYQPGDAPVQLENRCSTAHIRVRQHNTDSSVVLAPNQMLLFAWPHPAGTKVLEWQMYGSAMSIRLDPSKDGYGEEKRRLAASSSSPREYMSSEDECSDSSDTGVHSANSVKVRKRKEPSLFWACFPKGPQRILLITQERSIFIDTVSLYFRETCLMELLISMGGLSLSIFCPEPEKKEYLNASICDIPAIWEVNVGRTWKTLTFELAAWIEDHYRLNHKKCHIENYVHVDLEKMFMLKPFFAELRRSYWPAVYFHHRKSVYRKYSNLKIKNVQVDDHLNRRIILRPISANNLSSCSDCFLELVLSAVVSTRHTNFKWIKCSIKDLNLFIDNDMIAKLYRLLSDNKRFYNNVTSSDGYIQDVKAAHYNKATTDDNCSRNSDATMVENLSMSSWSIHLHTASGGGVEKNPSVGKVTHYLFPQHLSPFMPPGGIIHKISPTECIRLNSTINEAVNLMRYRTASQFLQQYYSQVLGLQVLLNPFAAQKDEQVLRKGAPDEATGAERTLRAWRYILGHIATGPAVCEPASRAFFPHQHISGGYRQKSSRDVQRHSFSVPDAVGALLIPPKSSGTSSCGDPERFFGAGSGRALAALADRGVISASAAGDALNRAQVLAVPGAPMTLRRGSRICRPFTNLRPYDSGEVSGRYLLEKISNGRFASDTYWTHAVLEPKGSSVVIVTLRNVIYVGGCPTFKPREAEWVLRLDNLLSLTGPSLEKVELVMQLRQKISSYGQEIRLSGERTALEHLYHSIRQVMTVTAAEDVTTPHS